MTANPNPQSQPTPRVLVVDDNAENRALARATLEDEGYAVLVATTGEEGVRLFETEAPDCILLDVRMPGTDGFVVCSRVRDLPGGKDVPVIFLTALRDVDTFDRALRVGGDDFLTKPVRPTQLLVRVQAALKLRRMSADLREQYDLVRRQRDDLMRLQLQKERLTAFVVHDLKNPVNAIDLHAQVLLATGELSTGQRAGVLEIRDQARSLVRLITNLLDISKSEEGRLSPRRGPVDLGATVAEVIEAFEIRARAAGVELATRIVAPSARGDVDLVRRVIENLLDNSIRHAPPGTVVRLTAARYAAGVEIRVADTGPGIEPALRDLIFERFVQAEGRARRPSRGGRGLGLAFCKLAVEAHGGTIWVEDGAPGAVFCVRLPDDP